MHHPTAIQRVGDQLETLGQKAAAFLAVLLQRKRPDFLDHRVGNGRDLAHLSGSEIVSHDLPPSG